MQSRYLICFMVLVLTQISYPAAHAGEDDPPPPRCEVDWETFEEYWGPITFGPGTGRDLVDAVIEAFPLAESALNQVAMDANNHQCADNCDKLVGDPIGVFYLSLSGGGSSTENCRPKVSALQIVAGAPTCAAAWAAAAVNAYTSPFEQIGVLEQACQDQSSNCYMTGLEYRGYITDDGAENIAIDENGYLLWCHVSARVPIKVYCGEQGGPSDEAGFIEGEAFNHVRCGPLEGDDDDDENACWDQGLDPCETDDDCGDENVCINGCCGCSVEPPGQ